MKSPRGLRLLVQVVHGNQTIVTNEDTELPAQMLANVGNHSASQHRNNELLDVNFASEYISLLIS